MIKQKSIALIYYCFNLGYIISCVFEVLQVVSFIHAVHISTTIWIVQCCLSMLNSLENNFYARRKASFNKLWQDIEYSSYGNVFVLINRNERNIWALKFNSWLIRWRNALFYRRTHQKDFEMKSSTLIPTAIVSFNTKNRVKLTPEESGGPSTLSEKLCA